MEQEDELQRVTQILETLTSEHDADRQQIEKLTRTVAEQNAYIKLIDEEQSKRLDQLSTSQQPAQPSTVSLDDETKTRLSEIESTLAAVAQQLSESALVKLRDGSSMKRSDLEALSVLKTVRRELETTTSASADLADAVRKRGQVTIDTDKLTKHAVKVLDARLARAVEAPVRGVEQVIEGFERRVANISIEKLDDVTARAEKLERSAEAAERRIDRLATAMTWTTVGRVCLALVPFAVVFIIIGVLVGGVTQMLGAGPLFSWAWDSFVAATAWWAKVLIAVGTLTGCGLFGLSVWWGGKKLCENYRGW